MKTAIIFGTRPEVIKMSPVVGVLEKKGLDYFIIHSNQHYSENMDKVFFEELNLPMPKYNLGIGSAEHGNQTGRMLIEIERILLDEKPGVLLAQGDTNTVLAGILAAAKQNIPCGHVEAGLRSYDRSMPEEKNRIICDSISDYLFAPTAVQRTILEGEGIDKKRIHVVGNTITDAVYQNKGLAAEKSSILERLGLEKGEYVLLTAHRASNVDTKESLEKLIRLIKKLKELSRMDVIYPMHPRTAAKLSEFGLKVDGARIIEPVGYLDSLALQMNADLVVTDSGGMQEEACILGVPCITIRENTERPETVEAGANRIVGLDVKLLEEAIECHRSHNHDWKNPFGDGKAAERIVNIIEGGKI
jgi:UDP-N-acetylglucosamine 2-epimerase (non-hydrolysing)